jgi:DNA-binding NarL/FixJ family response regulator
MSVTPRQKEVGVLIASGFSNNEIAERLGLALPTVEAHRDALFAKLGVHNAVQLTHQAIKRGWITVKRPVGRPKKC